MNLIIPIIIYCFLHTTISVKYSSIISNKLLIKSSFQETTMSTIFPNNYNYNKTNEIEKNKSVKMKQISSINCITTNTKWDDCNEHFEIGKYINYLKQKLNSITCGFKMNKTVVKTERKIKKT